MIDQIKSSSKNVNKVIKLIQLTHALVGNHESLLWLFFCCKLKATHRGGTFDCRWATSK